MPFDHFDLIAGCYDRAGPFNLSEPFLGYLTLSSENLLLDAGGGTGRVALALRGLVREVFVADVSRGMLRRAAMKGLAAVNSPAESLPFPPESVDRVVMVDALHHVSDQYLTIKELWRVLAPGGRIVIIEPDIDKLVTKLIALIEKILMMRSHFLSGEKISALFIDPDASIHLCKDGFNVILIAEK